MSITTLRDVHARAKRQHRCESCGRSIREGDIYSRRTYVYDGTFMSEALHSWCRAELDWFLEVSREDEFDFWWVSEFVDEEITAYGYEAKRGGSSQ